MKSRPTERQGIIFITALGVIIVLTALVLIFAQNMRTESLATANRLSDTQADAVEQGAEKWVLANVEANAPDALTITEIPANAMQLNGGYFWLLSPDMTSTTDADYQYGIVDECSKLNLNVATQQQLMALPNVTDEMAASVIAWRGTDVTNNTNATASSSGTAGTTSTYYQTLPEPYAAKNAPFETVDELLLVKDFTPQVMFGYDTNRDGVISAAEQQAGGTASTVNSQSSGLRGIANDLTVFTVQPNSAVNVNNTNSSRLQSLLTSAISAARANVILNNLASATRGGTRFASLSDFYTASGMTADEFKAIAGQVTANNATTLTGMVNPNTAGREVLEALFANTAGSSLTSSDADTLITARGNSTVSSAANTSSSTTPTLGWVVDALGPTKAAAALDYLTATSVQYSADIVAVSPDGRAFKRVRIVVDVRAQPAKIVYRRDLTELGWPLPDDIRQKLRSGQSIDVDQPNSETTGNGVTGS